MNKFVKLAWQHPQSHKQTHHCLMQILSTYAHIQAKEKYKVAPKWTWHHIMNSSSSKHWPHSL